MGLSVFGAFFYRFIDPPEVNASSSYSLKFKPEPDKWSPEEVSLAWIGHSTVLINFFGKWIITDPWLFKRVGIYFLGTNMGPGRITPPALSFDEIPKPDLILLSHAHMDHMDYLTLKRFTEKYPGGLDVITAYLTKDVIEDLEWKSIRSIDWNEEINFNGIRIKALEVKHFGHRMPWEKDRSRGFMKDGRSYNAYLLEYKGKKIIFGGDTSYTNLFEKQKDEKADIAIMPIGAYNPWIRNHCNPEQALQMAEMAGAKYFVPIHCKTLIQSSEPVNEPIEWLRKSISNYTIKPGLDSIGQTFILPK